MFEFLKHISDLIFDNSKSWGKRTSTFISLLFFLILADFTFNISFNIFTENKLNQLEKITKLKEDYNNNNDRLKEIKTIESEIFKREHYTEFISRNFNELSNRKNIGNETNKIEDKRSIPLMILSSNTILIIMVFILILPIFGGKEARQSNFFIGFFSSLLFISFLIGIVTIISYQIPLINNNPKLNYLTNFLIQILFYWVFYLIFKKKNNKNVA